MTTLLKLYRILATETADGTEIVVQAEAGADLRVLATRDQIDLLTTGLGTVGTLADASEKR